MKETSYDAAYSGVCANSNGLARAERQKTLFCGSLVPRRTDHFPAEMSSSKLLFWLSEVVFLVDADEPGCSGKSNCPVFLF